MQGIEILGLLAALSGLIAAALFRKGGPYNPPEEVEESTLTVSSPPPVYSEPTHSTPKVTLEDFCLALRDFEGKPGDQNYRLNNPGNCRYNPSGYLPMYGEVGRSANGFAIFKDYETGWLYLKNMVRGQIHKRPNQTILEFMHRYAPPADSNPTENYAMFIGKRLGVDSRTFLMKDLV